VIARRVCIRFLGSYFIVFAKRIQTSRRQGLMHVDSGYDFLEAN